MKTRLILLCLLVCLVNMSFAQNPAHLTSLTVTPQEVTTGDTITLTVTVDQATFVDLCVDPPFSFESFFIGNRLVDETHPLVLALHVGGGLTDTIVTVTAGPDNSSSQTATCNQRTAKVLVHPLVSASPDLGTCKQCESSVGHPINVANGNTYVQKQDLFVPTNVGAPLEISRTWNSLWLSSSPFAPDGMFGNGWISNYDQRLQFVSSTSASCFIGTPPRGQSN